MEPLRHLLPRHQVDHLAELGWKGKKDKPLLADAGRAGYDVFLTLDRQQLNDPDECKAIKASGIHHVRYEQRRPGLPGLALAIGAVIAAMPAVMLELEAARGQRLVRIVSLDHNAKRYDAIDPAIAPPAYWPRRRPPAASRHR
jgi:hypothetical protein